MECLKFEQRESRRIVASDGYKEGLRKKGKRERENKKIWVLEDKKRERETCETKINKKPNS